jgi:peroxiredoxin (alkyl hydroperoxide reductase subunit C)
MSEIQNAPRPAVTLPLINDPAPQFSAPSTHGTTSLADFKGKWVVLFSHPADFTPVCTTEFVGFARETEAFSQMNTQLIGLSIDSVGVKVTFPVIADLSMDVAKKYGMLHPGASSTATVRCVFVIDPDQNLRAMMYYPLTTGRVVGEIKRLVQALQLNTEKGLATPEGWQPGDKCIVPPPTTMWAAKERVESDYEVTDWYFSKTDCPT